jgi:amino acid adenylation domain-containing protein/FkbH-like protein
MDRTEPTGGRPGVATPGVSAFDVLAHARAVGISLTERDGTLVYRGREEAITPELLNTLRLHKQALLQLLREGLEELENEEEIVPLPPSAVSEPSLVQERLWLVNQMAAGSAATNIPLVCRLRGAIARDALEQALRALVRDHAALRTRFEIERGALRVRIVETETEALSLEYHDLAVGASTGDLRACEEIVRQVVRRPFDAAQAPLLGASLVALAPGESVFSLVVSHLVADAMSLRLLCEDLSRNYAAALQGAPLTPAPQADGLQYADYAAWLRRRIAAGAFDARLRYWTDKLGGRLPVLRIAGDYPRPRHRGVEGAVKGAVEGAAEPVALSAELTRQILAFSKEHDTTPYVVLLCVFLLELFRYSSEPDLLVGTPMAGRDRQPFARIVGPMANIIVLRNQVAPDDRFLDLLAQAKQTWRDALSNDVPFELLLQKLKPERSSMHSLFFQAMLDVQMGSGEERPLRLGDVAAEPVHFDTGAANFDLHLSLAERDGVLEGALVYRTSLFHAEGARAIARDFVALATRAIEQPDDTIRQLLAPQGCVKRPVVIAANFLADPLAEALDTWLERLHIHATITLVPMDGLVAALLDEDGPMARNADGINIVLIDPSPLAGDGAARALLIDALRARVRPHADWWCAVLEGSRAEDRGSRDAEAAAMVDGTIDALAPLTGVTVKDFRGVAGLYGIDAIREDAAGADGLRYGETYFQAVGTHLARHLWRRLARVHKAIVVDCDYTLWDGACSEMAVEELRVDAERLRFQRVLLDQVQAGVLLCLCSRNDEADVLRVLDQHPDMLIRAESVAAMRVNHLPKSQNLASVAAELNLSPDDFIFIDDDPRECAEVGHAQSQVLWLQFPRETAALAHWIDHLWVLDGVERSVESRTRAQFYARNEQRTSFAARCGTLRAILSESRFAWQVREASAEDIERVAELTRRTNQFNLDKHPLTHAQLTDWRDRPGARIWIVSASDSFGEYGTVGAALTRTDGATRRIEQFVLSCRAMHRGVEYALLRGVAEWAADQGDAALYLAFRPNPKNRPASLFVDDLARLEGVTRDEQGCLIPLDGIGARLDLLQAELLDKPFTRRSETETASAPSEQHPRPQATQAHDVLRALAAELPDMSAIRRVMRKRERGRDVRVEYLPPRTGMQRLLAEVVGEHLHVQDPGIQDDLFALGLDSLRALQIASNLTGRGLAVRIDDVFEHPTIESLAQWCESTGQATAAADPVRDAPFRDLDDVVAASLRAEGIDDAYPLSSTQVGMVFHADRDVESPLYQVIDSFKLRGPFDDALFRRVLAYIVSRHPALRTSFELARFQLPMQLVHRHLEISLEVVDLRGLPSAAQETQLTDWLAQEPMRRFDITVPPLVKYTVHLFDDGVFQVTLTQHHAILDGWSLNSLVKELLTTYAALLAGRALPAPVAPVPSFADFIRREQAATAADEQRAFWRRTLDGMQASEVPRWTGRAASPAILAEASYVSIPLSLSRGLFETARLASLPIKSVLLAAHVRAVMYMTGNVDVVTGLLVNGRPEGEQSDRSLGLFVNSIPLRMRVTGGSWLDLIRQVFEHERELQPYRMFPLRELQRMSAVAPLFEYLFTYTHFHVLDDVRDQPQFEVLDTFNFVRDNFPLQAFFDIDPFNDEHIRLMLGYDAARIPPPELDRIAALYLELLARIAAAPQETCFPKLLPTSMAGHLRGRAQVVRDAPSLVPVHQQVARHARQQPDKIAVATDGSRLTYAALDRGARTIAAELHRRGIGLERIVGVAMEAGPEAVLAILGILYAKAAYLPIDPSYPTQRIEWMLQDSAAEVLIVDRRWAGLAPAGVEVIFVDDMLASDVALTIADEPEAMADQRLAYVIYTSGSTGRPKGVLVSHASLTHLFVASSATFPLASEEVWSLFHSVSFDFSVWEMWAPLVSGGTLVPLDQTQRLDPDALRHSLFDHQVDVLNLTPSAVSRLLATGPLDELARTWPVERLVVGGEALPPALGRQLLEAGIAFWNFYGPTEATVWAGASRICGEADLHRLGHSFENVSLDVLDQTLQHAIAAVPGEICIGGFALARGYHRRPALTAERFVPDPLGRRPGARLYRTGDVGRYLADGALQYIERKDLQRKVRGYRIELGEIEVAMQTVPEIEQAVAVVPPGDVAVLRGYYTLKPGASIGKAAVRLALERSLPPYMVPDRLIELEAFPTGPTGKLDRAALAKRDLADEAPLPPAHALTTDEFIAAEAWSSALGVAVDRPEANFFELGGDSVTAAQVTARIRLRIGAALPLRELFRNATLKEYAAVLPRYRGAASDLLARFPTRTADAVVAPLTHAQHRLWIVDQLVEHKAVYNIPVVFECRGPIDVSALEEAVRRVAVRQRLLMARVTMIDDEPMLEYQPTLSPAIARRSLVDALRGRSDAERRQMIEQCVLAEVQIPFDLDTGPLLRIAVLEADVDLRYIVGVVHHLVADAWSVAILRAEIVEQYRLASGRRHADVQPLEIDYFDYALWQRDSVTEEHLRDSYAFWRERLAGGPPPFALGPRPAPLTDEARAITVPVTFETSTSEALKASARRGKVTLFSLLLGAFETALYAQSGQPDLWIGTGVANRPHPLTESIVGLFVNTLVFRTQLQPAWTLAEAVAKVHEQVLAAHEHQQVPYEELVRLANPPRVGRNRPLFHALFELHNAPNRRLELPGVELTVFDAGNGFAKYGVSLQLQETPSGLSGAFEIDASLYTPGEAKALSDRFRDVVLAWLRDPDITVASLSEARAEPTLTPEQRGRRRARLSAAFARSTRLPESPEQNDARDRVDRSAGTRALPLTIERAGTSEDLAVWIRTQRDRVRSDLHAHGAVLFRGFGVQRAADVKRVASEVMERPVTQNGEHVAVAGMDGVVQTPVFYAPDSKLLWHNENTFNSEWPRRIMFVCGQPAATGGETPLVDGREVFRRLPREIREPFVSRGVMYVRNYGKLGLPWTKVFGTESRAEVEDQCRADGVRYEWRTDGSLKTVAVRPAAYRHPDTNEWTWCNQAQHWHVACLDAVTRAYILSATTEDRFPRSCYYGDGTPIPDAVMQVILGVYQELEVTFPWKKGDVLLVDNLLTAHGRNPYTGERQLFVVIGDTFCPGDA